MVPRGQEHYLRQKRYTQGTNIHNMRQEGSFKDKCYYTLSFSMNFKHDNDTIWIAHSYPYTFTQLSMYLNDVFENNHKNKYIIVII